MKFNSTRRLAIGAVGALCLSFAITACGSDDNGDSGNSGKADKVAVLLPDSKSSVR
jgi:hypothetical protein